MSEHKIDLAKLNIFLDAQTKSKCSKCSCENSGSAIFCVKCGERLDHNADVIIKKSYAVGYGEEKVIKMTKKEFKDFMNRPDINIGELLKIEDLAGMTVWQRFYYDNITLKGLKGIFFSIILTSIAYLPFLLIEQILSVYDILEWWMTAYLGVFVSLFMLYCFCRWYFEEKKFDSFIFWFAFIISCISCFLYCCSSFISNYLRIIIVTHVIAYLILFFTLYYFYRSTSSPLSIAFDRLGNVGGMSLKEIQAKVGKYENSNKIEFSARGKQIMGRRCTWSDGEYSCSLLFDQNEICVGFEDK